MKRISTHETEFTPFSKLVTTGSSDIDCAIEPNIVSSPTEITTPVAAPLITLLPINAKLLYSVRVSFFSFDTSGIFSKGSLSPVKADWLINKSLASIILISAGIISPAAR